MNPTEELLKSLYIMASLVEARDPYTGGHLWRVSKFSGLLADAAGLSKKDTARIALGGFLHDLGKIAVPDAILRKAGHLTDDEHQVIKTHPEVGFRFIADHPLVLLVKEAILAHHERPDGTGYPYGLKADAVSVDAKIVGITDAFDAMTSTRPYRQGMPKEKALAIIGECAGKQFDAELSQIFIRLGNEGALDHIIGHSDSGIPLQECPACGPGIVVRRDQKSGDTVVCRVCTYKTKVVRDNNAISLEESDEHGTPADLQPEVDMALINELVEEAARLLAGK